MIISKEQKVLGPGSFSTGFYLMSLLISCNKKSIIFKAAEKNNQG
jgi:hypothetical protein